jgi:hypothetical protein
MHGHHFAVTCTDGGWVPESARWPEAAIDIPVGAIRAFEFMAEPPGDWALHCHKSHHTMNAMGHDVRTYIGVDMKDVRKKISKVVGGGFMPMGSRDMAEMGEMEMAAPDNTVPMMTGFGQFGPMEMGGMFTVVKVRDGLAPDDYKDPGWYTHPQGTVAFEWQGDRPSAAQAAPASDTATATERREIELKVLKPGARGGHGQH